MTKRGEESSPSRFGFTKIRIVLNKRLKESIEICRFIDLK